MAPVFVVDLADDLADLERRLNALAQQRFEPLQIIPLMLPMTKSSSPISFCIVAVQQRRIDAVPELDYRSGLRADHEGPSLPPRNGHVDLGRR